MAELEGARSSAEFCVRSIAPDVCKSPSTPVPYSIVSFFDCAVNFSTNVNFRKQPVFRHNTRLSTVIGNEPGLGGGIFSQVNKGWCRPIDGTSSTRVRVNGHWVPRHQTTYMFMNCAGPEGTPNTVGQVFFLGNMLPGPVTPSGKIPKDSFCGTPDITQKIQDLAGGSIDDLIKKGQLLYDLAKTDWSDPSAVLGAVGGVAGIAGLQDLASAAKQAKELYDTGNKLMSTDWSDPKQALAAIAGVASVANMRDIAQAAQMALKIGEAIRADWSDPRQAFAAARNIMQATGLNEMFAQMASNAILNSNIPVNTRGNLPAIFPPPGGGAAAGGSPTRGSARTDAFGASSSTCHIPPSPAGTPRFPLNQQVVDYLKEHNPVAYDRYTKLSDDQKCRAFVEIANPKKGETHGDELSRSVLYIPGEGFSSSKADVDKLPNVSRYLPDGFTSLFVASKDSRSIGRFFGIEQKEGNAYLFGGLIDLGSPGMPGAGTAFSWWVPDRILNADMSGYYDKHDRDYYGGDVRLGKLGEIFGHEFESFGSGATLNPLQLPLQALYSTATTLAGVGTATFNSLGDFMSSVFGIGSMPTVGGQSPQVNSIMPGGCIPDLGMGPGIGGSPGMTTPPSGTPVGGGCFPGGSGTPPTQLPSGKPSVPEGDASGAGTDGVVITIAAGNPSAAADAILAEIKQANDEALAEAREKERQDAEKAKTEMADGEGVEIDQDKSTEMKSDSEVAEQPADQNEPWRQKLAENLHDDDLKLCHENPTSKMLADGELDDEEHLNRNKFNWCPPGEKPDGNSHGIDWKDKAGWHGLGNQYHEPLECVTGKPHDGSLGPGSFECCYEPNGGQLNPNSDLSGTYNYSDGAGFTIPNPGIIGPDRLPIGDHGAYDVLPHEQNSNYEHVNMTHNRKRK